MARHAFVEFDPHNRAVVHLHVDTPDGLEHESTTRAATTRATEAVQVVTAAGPDVIYIERVGIGTHVYRHLVDAFGDARVVGWHVGDHNELRVPRRIPA